MLITEGQCVICAMNIDQRESQLVEDNTKNISVSNSKIPTCLKTLRHAVLWIRDVYPGSGIKVFPQILESGVDKITDPGSRSP
jgi:hypothetical protein